MKEETEKGKSGSAEGYDGSESESDSDSDQTYDYQRYLPPYRSLIHPGQVYDYQSHQYLNMDEEREASEDAEDTGCPDKPRSTDSEGFLRSILNPITTTTHKLLDAASDTFSVKSLRSRMSFFRLSLHSLPNEILLEILYCLRAVDRKALLRALYVNKRFYRLARMVVYEDPYITTTFRLAQFVRQINLHPETALLVKTIDLSRIRIGIDLDEAERDLFATNIVFGSCGGQYDELLTQRRILAGWRDFKYRFTPPYMLPSSTAAPSSTSFLGPPKKMPVRFGRNPMYAPSRHHSVSTDSTDSINSLFSIYRERRGSGNELRRINSRPRLLRRASEHSATSVESGADDETRRHRWSWQANSGSVDGDSGSADLHRRSSRQEAIEQPGFFNSFQAFVVLAMKKKHTGGGGGGGRTMQAPVTAVRRSPFQPQKSNIYEPFGTPHPTQSEGLKQYCFAKDIPVGFLLHIIQGCTNLQELNLSGLSWSVDFQLDDFEYFDWQSSRGKVYKRAVKPTHEYKSMLLTGQQKMAAKDLERQKLLLEPFRAEMPVYWSDTVRQIDFRDPALRSLTIKNIWESVLQLQHLRVLRLCNLVCLDRAIVRKLALETSSASTLSFIDCTGSGLSQDSQWATAKTAEEWREFFGDD